MADGYRPAMPVNMAPGVSDLIEWCWKQDPNERPRISSVIECLAVIRVDMEAKAAADLARRKSTCGCTMS